MIHRRYATAALTALFCLTTLGAFAQEHDRDHDRDHHEHDRFDDNDRRVAREWYEHHHDHPPVGFRERDRLEAQHEALLREDYVLDSQFRARIHPIPAGLRLPPPPRHQRYVVIGGHIVLIDNEYRVHDVIHLELNM